jgi:hypothetical protein
MLATRYLVILLPAFHAVFVMAPAGNVKMTPTPILANAPKADNNHLHVFERIEVLICITVSKPRMQVRN